MRPTPLIAHQAGAHLLTAAAGLLLMVASGFADEPYKRMLDDDLDFTGTETLSDMDPSPHVIVIGLFSPDDENHVVGRAMVRGATVAVAEANAAGGVQGRTIRLVRRWADEPWAAGSKEVVRLIFEDRAWVVIGGPDGASTHILQQVATKAYVPMIVPISTDPSLTRTRVPWIFRLPPDDAVQAGLLAGEIAHRGLARIGLVTSTDHDGRTAAGELVSALETAGSPPVFHLEVAENLADPSALAQRIATFGPDVLIIRLENRGLRRLAAALREIDLGCPIFVPWVPGLGLRRFPLDYPGETVSIAPFEPPRGCGPFLKLVRSYIARYGERPTPAAVFGYDAARLIIEALEEQPSGRVALRKSLGHAAPFLGASGPVDWDNGGSNAGAMPVLFTTRPR
jgi:branched-chain amino acid transport system substrate-binding protein